MDTNYNPEDPSSYIMYVDCNNLYGHSMMQHLPVRGFQWCDKEFTAADIQNISDDSEIGYILEVDLDYPKELHEFHNDYPFCAENRNIPGTENVRKLLLTLFDKKNYVIHYRMLKLVLKHGLVLKEVHRVLQFEQSDWLKSYIMLNTEMRTKATNEFEKNLFKYIVNAIFGKSIENVRSHSDIRLVNKWEGRYGAGALIAKPNFKKRIIFDENLAAIEMSKTTVLMDKPISVGMTILDISKVVMYEFYYNFLKNEYGENVRMAYTDTDSFVLHVKTPDFYADMMKNIQKYDTSDYPKNNRFGVELCNKKIPGLFKDEMKSEIITKFVGLRSKMYSIRTASLDKKKLVQGLHKYIEKKRAKGVKKCVLEKQIEFDDYVNCIQNGKIVTKDQNSFRTKLHNMYTIKQTKIALSPNDDKRVLQQGTHDTIAYGHYCLNN